MPFEIEPGAIYCALFPSAISSAIKKRPVLALAARTSLRHFKIVLTGSRASGLDYATCRIRENWND